jgi:stearoyl-CoA desaturase (delta-9 desaturase)
MTHITILCVTLYLHRSQTHRAVTFNPAVNHFMRFWLWLTTGMVTKEWVSTHRKHHRFTEQQDDPHSPHDLHTSLGSFFVGHKFAIPGIV